MGDIMQKHEYGLIRSIKTESYNNVHRTFTILYNIFGAGGFLQILATEITMRKVIMEAR